MKQLKTETTQKQAQAPPHGGLGLTDYVGVVHVHTTYSDGGDDMPSVIEQAQAAGLDFVVISDHNNIKALDEGWSGRHDGVLIVVGSEISSRNGHCVAMNVDKIKDFKQFRKMEPADFLRIVKESGGYAFIAHPTGNIKRQFNIRVKSWRDWHLDTFAGLEIWPYMHDWVKNMKLRTFFEAARSPDDFITGPEPAVLELWDELGKTRHISGIGSLDSHSRGVPFNWLPWKLMTLFPLEHVFRTVRTHVLVEPYSDDGEADTRLTVDAMVAGRCYVDYLPNGDATGFEFFAEREGSPPATMGDEIPEGDWTFTVRSPIPSEIRILRDGQAFAQADGTELHAATAGAGVYRVEAHINGGPWVYTNPIYLRDRDLPDC